MPEDLVSSGCSSSFVLEYDSKLKPKHISFIFLVLWPIMVVFMHFAQETVRRYLQQSLGPSTYSSFSSFPLPYQLAFRWFVVSLSCGL